MANSTVKTEVCSRIIPVFTGNTPDVDFLRVKWESCFFNLNNMYLSARSVEAKLSKLKADIDIWKCPVIKLINTGNESRFIQINQIWTKIFFISPYIAGTERQMFPFFLPATVLHHSHTRGRCPQLVIVFCLFLFCLSLALDHQYLRLLDSVYDSLSLYSFRNKRFKRKKWRKSEIITKDCLPACVWGLNFRYLGSEAIHKKTKQKNIMWLLRVVCLCNSKRVKMYSLWVKYTLWYCSISRYASLVPWGCWPLLTFDCSVTSHVTVWRTDHSSWPIPAGCVAVTAALNRVDTFNKTSSLQSLGYYDAFCGNNKNINRKIELN